jgi:hypothetical protein
MPACGPCVTVLDAFRGRKSRFSGTFRPLEVDDPADGVQRARERHAKHNVRDLAHGRVCEHPLQLVLGEGPQGPVDDREGGGESHGRGGRG